MSAKHTPGPWEVDSSIACRRMIRSRSHHAGQIATVYENYDANASLIAAAPDLLAALRGCIDVMLSRGVLTDPEHPDRIALAAARAAIAKATQP